MCFQYFMAAVKTFEAFEDCTEYTIDLSRYGDTQTGLVPKRNVGASKKSNVTDRLDPHICL